MQKMDVNDLVPLNAFENTYPVKIDVVYSKPDHPDNHFKGLYHEGAQIMWAHKDIAETTLLASLICKKLWGWAFKINDCLRSVEAQMKMKEYGYDPSLVMLPGRGAHPRAMAIDIEPFDQNGQAVPMGTPFDFFADSIKNNPADRHYSQFQGTIEQQYAIWANRYRLEFSMRTAASLFNREIFPMPYEWWDFREIQKIWEQFEPLNEEDLHPYQRLIDPDLDGVDQILKGNYPDSVSSAIKNVRDNLTKAEAVLEKKSYLKAS